MRIALALLCASLAACMAAALPMDQPGDSCEDLSGEPTNDCAAPAMCLTVGQGTPAHCDDGFLDFSLHYGPAWICTLRCQSDGDCAPLSPSFRCLTDCRGTSYCG
jgi:hypothetical protein